MSHDFCGARFCWRKIAEDAYEEEDKMSQIEVHNISFENKLLEYSKTQIKKYNTQRLARRGQDTLYSFLITEEGAIYDGAAFEPFVAQATVCGERHAIANMVMNEAYKTKIESIVIADPVPRLQPHGTFPCGTCREIISQFGKPETSVLLLQYIREDLPKEGPTWIFPKVERFLMKELYTFPYTPDPNLWM